MTPFNVYREYLALKSHFSNPKYDYFKYNKKVRVTENSFKKRKDIYWFEKISRKYEDKEIVDFFVSNFISSSNIQGMWIGEIINSGEKIYKDWSRRKQSLNYLFKEQSKNLLSNNRLEDLFNCNRGHPIILKSFLSSKIDPEVLVIYEKIFHFSKYFNSKLLDPVWEIVNLKIQKYSPFLFIDTPSYKKILQEIVNE